MPTMVIDKELPSTLKDRAEGTTEVAIVRDVRADFREEDDGCKTLVITFVLADPPAGSETWPVEDLWELRRVAREVVPGMFERIMADLYKKLAGQLATTIELVKAQLPPFSWVVEFEPENMPPLSPGDEQIEF